MLKRVIDFIRRAETHSIFTGNIAKSIAFMFWTKLRPYDKCCVQWDGTKFCYRGVDYMALMEVLISREYEFINAELKTEKSPMILDVGAHIGLFALSVLKKHSEACIISVEGDPETFEVLRINNQLNKKKYPNWKVINKAAWSESNVEVGFTNYGPSMSHKVDDSGSIRVKTISLEDLISEIEGECRIVDMIKIDIEGGEEQFICGPASLALSVCKSIVIELHPEYCDCEKIKELLESNYKFVINRSQRTSSKPLLYCK
jgi:FkbM family methyltransferase